jgi:hypothetical protein
LESALPAGTLGVVDVCSASYVTNVNASLPAAAGAVMVQVSGTPEHAGLLGVRLLAIDAGVPVYGVPLTLTKVTIADCVEGETNFGARATDAGPAAGIVIVKRALVMSGEVPLAGVDVAMRSGAVTGLLAPPEQLLRAAATSAAKMRMRDVFIKAPER